jgi:hypothetical protein
MTWYEALPLTIIPLILALRFHRRAWLRRQLQEAEYRARVNKAVRVPLSVKRSESALDQVMDDYGVRAVDVQESWLGYPYGQDQVESWLRIIRLEAKEWAYRCERERMLGPKWAQCEGAGVAKARARLLDSGGSTVRAIFQYQAKGLIPDDQAREYVQMVRALMPAFEVGDRVILVPPIRSTRSQWEGTP